MSKLRVLDLFSGIGGFSLGLERTSGFETVAFCEIEPFPRRVLAKHWPEVPCYDDVRTLTGDVLRRDGIAVDVITGGFPCQDLSIAGKRAGLAGQRSGLWSEIARLVGELRPRYVILENVSNLLSGPSERRGGWFGRVLGDLAERGYDAEWENIPAAALGAPHRRERVWVLAWDADQNNVGAVGGVSSIGAADSSGIGQVLADPSEDRREIGGAGHDGCLPSTQGCVGFWLEPGRVCAGGGPRNVADPDSDDAQRQQPGGTDTPERAGPLSRPAGSLLASLRGFWGAEPDVGRVADGVPHRVDRLAGLGNAVVPQIPEIIGYGILQREADRDPARSELIPPSARMSTCRAATAPGLRPRGLSTASPPGSPSPGARAGAD